MADISGKEYILDFATKLLQKVNSDYIYLNTQQKKLIQKTIKSG